MQREPKGLSAGILRSVMSQLSYSIDGQSYMPFELKRSQYLSIKSLPGSEEGSGDQQMMPELLNTKATRQKL
jgi:hypothetical protein